MKINPELITRIKDALNIVDVIGDFITLHKKGINYIGYCPFHNDKHPSFYVNPARQIWRCFVEDKGGDIFSFIQEYENISFPEAVEWCARKANIEFKAQEQTLEELQRAKEREALHVAIKAAQEFYQSHLPDAADYLSRRGFNLGDEVLENFKIGYAPEENLLYKELIRKGYSEANLQKVGVIAQGKYKKYDFFQDRIMFPYLDLSGNIIGYSGRFIKPKENTGKYINTGDTPLFNKGKAVFGLYQSRRSIIDKDHVYIVEGQFDVVSLHAAGVTNVVAPGGTSLTPDHIKAIMRFTRNITLIYDGDDAGRKAALSKCKLLLQAGANVRCVALPDGKDPDNIARENKENTSIWLSNHHEDFVTYFERILNTNPEDAIAAEQVFTTIASLVAEVQKESLQNTYIRTLASKFTNDEVIIVKRKVRELSRELPKEEPATMKPGIYGLDELPKHLKETTTCLITPDFEDYVADYGDNPIIYIHGVPSKNDIQELRRICSIFTTYSIGLFIKAGEETDYMKALAELYKNGITEIKVLLTSDENEDEELDDEDYPYRTEPTELPFLTYYLKEFNKFFTKESPSDRSVYIQRCINLISYANEAVRIVNSKSYAELLGLNNTQYNNLLKPYIEKRKSRIAFNAQRSDDDYDFDAEDEVPGYVSESETYAEMYKNYKYYPRINKDGEPVGYIFENQDGRTKTLVGDFYMTPLLHIYDTEAEHNKRILKINRRFYKTPLYIEVQSKALLKKSTIEEILINLEAVNFSNGEEKHWTKIREWMSRNYTTCIEVRTYGNQQKEGFSRREDENFFAFSNGIFHFIDGIAQFTPVDDIGVVTHKDKNYYLPAFSKINAGLNRDSDKYESIRTLIYKEIPLEKQCSFERWAELMDKVYSINHNGKWAILYAIMCAFRSNIHCIDRLFTALFFMGPMMSGKTQIAISIRSLFISPKVPIFNLNTGTYAALSSLMSTFRDVPVVLDEYNNKDILDVTFQLLKGIVYDGDGRQKRKGTSGKEIESEKVYAPVILSGQETPQRDDNALMSRVIVCEVPKPTIERTEEQKALFQELKELEDPDKVGLSNVLFEVLKLRPIVQDHFKTIQRQVVKDLTKKLPTGGGDMVRIINTVSLFLAMCKLIEEYTSLQLPFTYTEFFEIAAEKVKTQVELISHTDKIATFFKAMDVMINTGSIKEGRDFSIDSPSKITIKLPGGDRSELILPPGTKVLYLRISNIYTMFARSSFNPEQTTQSTIEQNLRSNPSYIGIINSRRFRWTETMEVPRGGVDTEKDNKTEVHVDQTMIKKIIPKEQLTSCIALNYDTFRSYYDIDLERTLTEDRAEQPLPF